MKNFLIAFSIFLIWSFFALWLYSWLQPSTIAAVASSELIEETNDSIEKDIESVKFSEVLNDSDTLSVLEENIDTIDNFEDISDGLSALTMDGSVLFNFNDGIVITENQKTISIPESINDFQYILKNYLNNHPDEELHIEALYSPAERFETPNFGLQRGQLLKKELMDIGIPSEKIFVKSIIKGIEFSEDKTFGYGVNFTFAAFDATRKPETIANPEMITVYPTFSAEGIQVNEQLRGLLEEVKGLVATNPALKMNVVGHTDNIGNANDNYKSGLKYARQVRWYLVNKGKIDRKKIIATSEGESQSLASNKTDRGRKINKRIEVYFSLEE